MKWKANHTCNVIFLLSGPAESCSVPPTLSSPTPVPSVDRTPWRLVGTSVRITPFHPIPFPLPRSVLLLPLSPNIFADDMNNIFLRCAICESVLTFSRPRFRHRRERSKGDQALVPRGIEQLQERSVQLGLREVDASLDARCGHSLGLLLWSHDMNIIWIFIQFLNVFAALVGGRKGYGKIESAGSNQVGARCAIPMT